MRQAVLQTNGLVELIPLSPVWQSMRGRRGPTLLPVTRVVAHLPRCRDVYSTATERRERVPGSGMDDREVSSSVPASMRSSVVARLRRSGQSVLSNGMRYRVRFDCSGLFCWQAFCIGKRLCRAAAPRKTSHRSDVEMRETKAEEKQEEKNYLRREFHYGGVLTHRTPASQRAGEKATAQLKDGLLEIRIPKSAEARLQEIPVSV